MRLFSRNPEAVEPARGSDVAFESLKRSPRAARKPRVGDAERDAPPLDPAEASKTRARRRLIGAVALALAAIVFVPMLFDRTPVAPNDDIALQIPDRDSPFEGRRGVPDPSRGPLRAAPDPANAAVVDTPPSVAGDAGREPGGAPVAERSNAATPPVAPRTSVATVATPSEKPAEKQAEKPAEKPAEKQAERQPEKSAEKSAEKQPDRRADKPAASDDPRALAALEGRSAASAAEPAGERSYAVQVAAFSAPDKARGLRDQLVGNGLKSYTESVSTAQGLRTRVRLGPFASREAADRAKQKLKTMKLDGSVVPL